MAHYTIVLNLFYDLAKGGEITVERIQKIIPRLSLGWAMASATYGLSAANQWTQSWEYNSSQQAQTMRVKKGAQT